MIVVYSGAGCWACEEGARMLNRAGLKHQIFRVRPGSDLARELVETYPNMADPTRPEGVLLPIFVEDGVLVGDYVDMKERIG